MIMFVQNFQVQNFKSFRDVTIYFNQDVNILTGKNNSGKTTILEALSLWYECFTKLLTQANSNRSNYQQGDWILGIMEDVFSDSFPIGSQFKSVRINYEDIFYECQSEKEISLGITFCDGNNDLLEIKFNISKLDEDYKIVLNDYTNFDFKKFNSFFSLSPNPFSIYYASPISTVSPVEIYRSLPEVEQACIEHKSGSVIRNRLYQISRFRVTLDLFQRDLAYILQNLIFFEFNFDNLRERIIVKYKIQSNENWKDISLLGSGTLQLIEILVNFYLVDLEGKEIRLVMLDEPDSYIHRDIQKRLIEIISRFASNTQIIISTHNESFIRSIPVEQLFHLDGKSIGEYHPINETEIEKLQPRFKGIYPSLINPIIRTVGEITGLDFINAIECDRLIFVEGEDDARYLNVLLKQQLGLRKRYMFWVLGGISEVFENILAYKTVFSAIKNGQNLWQKSCVVIDKDYLTHAHQEAIIIKFKEKYQLDVFSCEAYTFESTIFEDLELLSSLISQWLEIKIDSEIDRNEVLISLQTEYAKVHLALQAKYTDKFIEEEAQRYRDIREKTNSLFGKPSIIPQSDIQLTNLVRRNLQNTLETGNYYWLMRKDDVESVINTVTQRYGVKFACETDLIELIKAVTKATWMNQWSFLNRL
jgi:predicted ATP-dependent endonuclease of OLD family